MDIKTFCSTMMNCFPSMPNLANPQHQKNYLQYHNIPLAFSLEALFLTVEKYIHDQSRLHIIYILRL